MSLRSKMQIPTEVFFEQCSTFESQIKCNMHLQVYVWTLVRHLRIRISEHITPWFLAIKQGILRSVIMKQLHGTSHTINLFEVIQVFFILKQQRRYVQHPRFVTQPLRPKEYSGSPDTTLVINSISFTQVLLLSQTAHRILTCFSLPEDFITLSNYT